MKKSLLILVFLIICIQTGFSQAHHLGTYVTKRWIENFYPNSFNSNKSDGDYANAEIAGQISAICDVILKTDKDSILREIKYIYKNLTSKQAVTNTMNGPLNSVIEITDKYQDDRRMDYSAIISRIPAISLFGYASWDYNGLGTFIFRRCEITYTMMGKR